MRKAFYIILVAAAFLIPRQPQNLELLRPVEVLQISHTGNKIQLETDLGDVGEGETVELALADMKASASGTIYLDTTEFLLVSENAVDLIDRLHPYLKGSVRICVSEEEAEKNAAYLRAHPPELKLKHCKNGQMVQN